jgi:HlyD family secretion protein
MHAPRVTKRVVILLIALVLAGATVGYALRPDTVSVDTYAAARGPMRETIDEDGRTRVRNRFVVAAPVAGRLERITLREGDRIARGQIVGWIAPMPLDSAGRRIATARLDAARALSTEASSRVQQAKAVMELASNVDKRRKALLDAGAISLEQYEQSKTDLRAKAEELSAAASRLRSARADVTAALAALAPTEGKEARAVPVKSPVSGRVLRITEASERIVAASSPIIELGDAEALEVIADVLSSDAVRIQPGNRVEIAEWGGDRSLEGRVRAIEPSAYTRVSALGVDEQRVNVLVDILDPPASLGDGFRVEMRATVWEGGNVLAVPSSAVFQLGSGWQVFVVNENRARRRSVTIGHKGASMIEITSGLEPGERVILFPSDQIDEGKRVRVDNQR